MLLSAVIGVAALVLALGPLGGLPTLPIFPPSEPPPTPPPAPEQPPPAPSSDPDGFPNLGRAVFADRGKGSALRTWGELSCADAARVSKRPQGGPGPNKRDPFRRLQVLDGDDYYGERCELGLNDHVDGPTALYRDGERLITEISLKLSKRFPIGLPRWQVVAQMKQTQPADDGGGVPALALQVYRGRWRLVDRTNELWSAPVRRDQWTKFSFDITYADSPSEGTVRVAADLNGDGDAHDANERSRQLQLATLKTEGPGSDSDGIPEGTAIPSHLRAGIYHDPVYECAGLRCSIGIDDVGVYKPR